MSSSTSAWRTHLNARSSSISLSESPLIYRSPHTMSLDVKDPRDFSAPRSPMPTLVWRDKRQDGCLPLRSNRQWLFAGVASTILLSLCIFAGYQPPVALTTPLTTYLLPSALLKGPCEPYFTHGTLAIDHVDPDGTRWMPFDTSYRACIPPAYFRQLRHGRDASLGWLRNRTVLIIGDLTDRSHVEEFCTLLGYEAEIVRQDHPLAPPTTALRGAMRPDRIEHRAGPASTLPRICRVPEYGLTIASTVVYGLDEEDYWAGTELYTAPGLLEHRMTDVIKPFATALAKSLGQAGPDLVEFHSGSYDLARWARQDLEVGRSPEAPLADDRLAWYRFRVGKALSEVRRAFPHAQARVWRSIAFPVDQAAELNWFKDRPSRAVESQDGPHHFALARVHQLDQAARSLILPSPSAGGRAPAHSDVRFSPWGTLLLGHAAHSRDRTHGEPGAPGTTLWAEMLLFELHRAVTAPVPKAATAAESVSEESVDVVAWTNTTAV